MSTSSPASWRIEKYDNLSILLILMGNWNSEEAAKIAPETICELIEAEATVLRVETRELGHWNSVLMTFLVELQECCSKASITLDTNALPSSISTLFSLAHAVPERTGARRKTVKINWLEQWGDLGLRVWKDVVGLIYFLGEVALAIIALIRGRARFRRVDWWANVQECGPSAVPIVTLISISVGLILAFVGAVQLALFGAQIYIADLVALGMTREMGALMTAIIMSGRTGAAFAAQIGSMNVNLEISALKVMGFAPMEFLVLPRMLALICTMPVLCLYADFLGIIGGALVSIAFFDITPTQYIQRTSESVHIIDFFIGLGKCAVFGILIALSGCVRGMQCGRSASAVGEAATSAVVTAIVFIVVSDSILTLICNRLGI